MSVIVAVVGAGVVGLSTAINIQKVLPNVKVKIIADKFYEDTTSYGSAGSYLVTVPGDLPVEEASKAKVRAQASWDHFRQLAVGAEASKAGAVICTGYRLKKEEAKNKLECVFSDERIPDSELQQLGFPARFRFGYKATTVLMDMRRYLLWLMEQFIQNGGEKEERKLQNFGDLAGQYDAVVNCTGYGSKDLVPDKDVDSGRGVVVRVKAPWIKQWVVTDEMTYMFPGIDFVTLGGTKQLGQTSLDVTDEERDEVIRKCELVFPNIKGFVLDHSWAGLRPLRSSIRIEQETMSFPGGDVKVVHNYGHGGDGVGTSWGTAVEASHLVLNTLQEDKKV